MRLINSIVIIILLVSPVWAEQQASFQEKLGMGIERYELRDYEGAISVWEEMAKSQPDYSSAYYNMGLAYESLGNYAQAEKAYSMTLLCDPDDVEALIRLGVIYYKSGDYSASVERFEHAGSLDKNCIDAYYWLGKASFDRGNRQKAITLWNEALRLKPDDKLLLREKMRAQQLLQNQEDAYFYLRQGRRYHYLHKFTNAAAACRQAVLIDPQLTEAHYWLGRAYLRLGDREQAIKEWKLVLELDPDHTLAKKHIKEMGRK
ncbi:MAG: tetratricopeptide repeat protein [bacterium]|nr:tetratricopeptide repeat protein [bacterium]